jgi:hypothetical protein
LSKMVRALFDDVPVGTWTKNLMGDPLQIIIGLSVASDAPADWHTVGTPALPCVFEVAGSGAWPCS